MEKKKAIPFPKEFLKKPLSEVDLSKPFNLDEVDISHDEKTWCTMNGCRMCALRRKETEEP